MRLENDFVVPVPPARAWDILLDVGRVAGCLPGAAVESVDGDTVTGTVSVKLGPMSMTYRGTARFVERDGAARRIAVRAEGQETRGSGTAAATVIAQLSEVDDGTRVTVETDLDIAGRPAQFGRGVLADVSQRLLGEFADRLAAQLVSETASVSAPAGDAGASAQPAAAGQSAPLDLTTLSMWPLARRAWPALLAVAAFLVGRAVAQRKYRRSQA